MPHTTDSDLANPRLPRYRRLSSLPFLVLASLAPCLATPLDAGTPEPEWEVLVAESTLAIVTFRGGVAGRLAHDHLVHAGDFRASLRFDPESPERSTFMGDLEVRDLVVDELDRMARVQPVLQQFDLLPREFGDVGDQGRIDVREHMLAEDQLHSEAWPEISFRSLAVEQAEDDEAFPWRIDAALTVRGEERATTLRARWELDDEGALTVQAAGEFHFTDFGIEPYSAFFGTVRNQDRFVLFMELRALPLG